MPLLAIVLGIAGLVPFIICGLGAIGSDPAEAARMLTALVGYGAVVLGFLGGMQWGLALGSAPEAPSPGGTGPGWRGRLAGFLTPQRARLALGVVPALIGWAALLAQLLLADWIALVVLIVGFIGTVVAEHRAAGRVTMPPSGYLWLRWGLSIVVVAMLVTVVTLRLLGQRIIL